MSQFFHSPTRPDTAAAAIGQYLRVITPNALALAGAADVELGTMDSAATAAGPATVRLRSAEGTSKMVASGAITAGVRVYAAASGKIAATGALLVGVALEAATADLDIIEVLRLTSGSAGSGVTAYAVSGALAVSQHTAMITKAGVAAMTLAAPTAAQEGMTLVVVSQTAYAHTITATGLIDDGVTGGSKTTATFAAFAGAAITLMASNLKWAVISKNVVTIT